MAFLMAFREEEMIIPRCWAAVSSRSSGRVRGRTGASWVAAARGEAHRRGVDLGDFFNEVQPAKIVRIFGAKDRLVEPWPWLGLCSDWFAMAKLFISHASADVPIVEAFVELLESGIGVLPADIFCSSLKGQGLKAGTDFKNSIRDALADAEVVVALISERFYASAFCMCEMGGVWMQAKSFIPILVPPLGFDSLKAVLAGMQALKLHVSEDLDQLRDEIVQRLAILPSIATSRWINRRDRFLTGLSDLEKRVEKTKTVSVQEHEQVTLKLEACKKEAAAAEVEIGRLKARVDEISKLKDKVDVAKVANKHSSRAEEFEHLVSAARAALAPLPQVVVNVLYYRTRGDFYTPDEDEFPSAYMQIEEGLLKREYGNSWTPNQKNGKVRRAMEALDALSTWLESGPAPWDPPDSFVASYSAEHDEEPDLKIRTFWRRHLLQPGTPF